MAHWSSCAVHNEPALPKGECDCGNDATSEHGEWLESRRRHALSTDWEQYPGTQIEVFYDSAAVLYRIGGQIYAVPRQNMAWLPRDVNAQP